MRICIAHKYYFRGGGTASYVFSVTDILESHGHTVAPFSVGYSKTVDSPYSRYFVSPPLGRDDTHYVHFRTTPIAMLRLLGRATYSAEAKRKMSQLLADERIDIVYIQNIYNYISPSIIHSCSAMGVPVVMRLGDFNLVCPNYLYLRDSQICEDCKRGYYHALRHRCVKGSLTATAARVFSMYVHKWLRIYNKVSAFVTPSAFMREDLIKCGFPAERIFHIPSPIDPRKYKPSYEHDGYVLYFGRLSKEKGLPVLLRAFEGLPADLRLVIAGEDIEDHQAELTRLSESLGLKNVEFAGFKTGADLARLVGRCMFTVVPSLWNDNAPMSVIESFAYGKPVIGARLGGIPEQIDDTCGRLVTPGDVQELRDGIMELSSDPGKLRAMGKAARQRVLTMYSPETHYESLMKVFELCLSGSRRAGRANERRENA